MRASSSSLLRPLGLLSALTLAACGAAGGGGGGAPAPTTGMLQVRMHDHRVENADHVFVTIESVEVFKIVDGAEVHETVTSVPGQYDLLELQNGVEAVIGGASFAPGDYKSIRLMVARDSKHDIKHKPADELKNYIVVDGQAYPLVVPHGAKTGIKLGKNFSIVAGETTTLTLDFDLRLSVTHCGKKHHRVYRLKPRIRVTKVTSPTSEPAPVPPTDTPPTDTPPTDTPPGDGAVSGIQGVVSLGGLGAPENGIVAAVQNGVQVAAADLVTDAETSVISYSFTDLADGTYDLVLVAPGFTFASESGVVLSGGTTSSTHDLSASDASESSGSLGGVVDASAALSDNVTVRLLWNGFEVAQTGADGTTGDYFFDAVPAGDYTVVATDDTNTATSGTVTVSASSFTSVDTLTLP